MPINSFVLYAVLHMIFALTDSPEAYANVILPSSAGWRSMKSILNMFAKFGKSWFLFVLEGTQCRATFAGLSDVFVPRTCMTYMYAIQVAIMFTRAHISQIKSNLFVTTYKSAIQLSLIHI